MLKEKSFFSVLLLAAVWALPADDLILKNGKIYRNYRIKQIDSRQTMIVFTRDDGSPEVEYVKTSQLPDDLRNYYMNRKSSAQKPWRTGKTIEEKLELAGKQLRMDLAKVPLDDRNTRSRLAGKLAWDIQRVLTAAGMERVFQVVSADQSGVLVSMTVKKNQYKYLYLYNVKPESQTFKLKIYPTGDSVDYGRYGKVSIYAATGEEACGIAMGIVGDWAGDNAVFMSLPETVSAAAQDTTLPATAAPQSEEYVDTYTQERISVPVVVWGDYWYGVRPVPPHRPGKPGKPGNPGKPVKPGNPDKPSRPGKPGKDAVVEPQRPVRPQRPRGQQTVNFQRPGRPAQSGRNNSQVQCNPSPGNVPVMRPEKSPNGYNTAPEMRQLGKKGR